MRLVTFAEAETVVNTTAGAISLEALTAAGADNLAGKALNTMNCQVMVAPSPVGLMPTHTEPLGAEAPSTGSADRPDP